MEISLAPIQSYTYAFYRYAHSRTFSSFDRYYTPFFEDDKKRGWKPGLTPELDIKLNDGITIIPQIATNEPEFLIRSAEKFSEMGYNEINLNMGCPFPMLVKRGKGAGLLQEPKIVEKILNFFFRKTDGIELSVKMRLGIDEADEWESIIPILNNYSVAEVIVHPRSAKQKYGGDVNWDEFERLTEQCNLPVTGNGDINSRQDYNSLQKHFPHITSWMIGRGALTNPFLPGELKGISYSQQERKELFLKFHDTFLNVVKQYFPEWNHALNYMRSFWHYPLQNVENGQRHYKKLKKYLSEAEYQAWSVKLLNGEYLF